MRALRLLNSAVICRFHRFHKLLVSVPCRRWALSLFWLPKCVVCRLCGLVVYGSLYDPWGTTKYQERSLRSPTVSLRGNSRFSHRNFPTAIFPPQFSHREEIQSAMEPAFTWRAIAGGLCIGLLVNLSNTYYGLRIGVASQMSMVSALLGFISFKLLSRYLTAPLTPAENVLILSVSTATGCMPVTAGFIGIIPALEYLIGPEENGPLRLSADSLVIWSIGLCFFGLIFAAVFREHFVIREQLPWPGARAAAHLINTLHHRHPKPVFASPRILSSTTENAESETDDVDFTRERQALLTRPGVDGVRWDHGIQTLLRGAVLSWTIVRILVSHCISQQS